MRIVHTTRGEVCLQVGRVEGGAARRAGDRRGLSGRRALPPDARRCAARRRLPRARLRLPGFASSNSNTSCQLTGEVSVSKHVGLDRSAAASTDASTRPLRDLRDISYGILGEEAVSVSYRAGAKDLTEAVQPRIGAYLIVRRTTPGEQVGTGGGSLGTEGQLPPSSPLTTITYRLDGRLCQRGPVEPPGTQQHLSDPCPQPHWPAHSVRAQDLHQPFMCNCRSAIVRSPARS